MNSLKKFVNVRLIIVLIFISSIVIGAKVQAQNTLDKVGLPNSVTATGAYSLRLLTSSYKGPLVRITIGTNYYDVYPDASTNSIFSTASPISSAYTTYNAMATGSITGSLSSIVGSNTNATVAIWYDQSGNGNNVIQATTLDQPTIIASGAINTTNGLPSLLFNGSLSYPTYLQATSVGYSSNTPHTLNCVAAANTGAAVALSSTAGSYTNSVLGAGDPYQGAGYIWYGGYGQDGVNWTSGTATTNLCVRSKKYTPSNTTVNGYFNGTGIAPNLANTSATYSLTGNDILIGMQDLQPASVLNGALSEVFVFTSTVTDANRQLLEFNQGNYYGVTVSTTVTTNPIVNPTPNTLDKAGLSNAVPATGAYSLRLLSSAYKGPLARITVGNIYYDVYPDASNSAKFSTTSPVSAGYNFINNTPTGSTTNTLGSVVNSSTNATVAIWYDQSGNGNNVIQTTIADQPIIITAGAINTSNGLPSLLFNGSLSYPTYMQATSVGYSATTPHILNCVAAASTGVAVALSSIEGNYTNSVLGAGDPYQGAGDIWYGGYGQDGTSWTSGTSSTNLAVRTKKYTPSTTTVNGYYNGTVITSNNATTNATYNLTGNDILIGMQDFQPYAVLTGSLSEVFVFASTVADASRQALESNQGYYYGVTVSDAQPLAPTISAFAVAAQCSSTASFTLTAPNSNSQGAFTYTSSNTNVATISGTTVKIVGAGTSTITATQAASGNYTSGSITATLTVYAPTVLDTITGISGICVGGTIQLSNTFTGGTWNSSNNYIGPVNANGLFTANAPGTATITYTYTNLGGCVSSKTKVITVNNVTYTGPLLGSSTVCTGNNDTLVAAGTGIWTTSNPAIATNVNGIITGVAAGVDTVIYTLTNSFGCTTVTTAPITVLSNPIHLDTIVGNSIVCVGSTIQLSNSTSGGGVWSSFDHYVATISPTGLVTGNAYGTSTITYYVSNTNGCHSSITTVVSTVNDPYTGPILGSNIVCTSNNDTLRAAGSGSWTSSNPSIASINNGIVTGLTAGTDTILYVLTNSYGCVTTTTAPITVLSNPILLDSIVGPSNVCVGSTIQLTNSIPGGVWSSFSNYAGTITQTGVVTGNNYGSTTITYYVSNSNGCYAKTTKVILTQNLPYAGTISGTGSLCNGNTITLKPTVSNGVWSSTNNNITTVNGSGVVTGIGGGTDSIVYKITNSYGCVSTLYKSITDASTSSLTTANICTGSSYIFNGTSYNASGTYTLHLTNAAGCDSAATLKLTVSNRSTSTTNASICTGSSYTFNGTAYTAAGSYTVHLTNSAGCDSAATLVLTVKSPSSSLSTANICIGGAYTFNGNTYSTAGTYTVHLTNSAGCDSTATLVLTINQPTTDTLNVSTCAPYTWHDSTYTTSGTYTFDSLNAAGCDSLTILNLSFCAGSGGVTSGSTGGLESKSLGAAIGERNFNMYKNGKNGAVQYTADELITEPKRGSFGTFGITTTSSLLATMPDAVSTYIPYDQSASVSDLTGITNAVEVHAIDFTQSNLPKAVAFATKTIGNIYGHTKPICDRLKGAELQDIAKVSIQGMNFIQYKLLQPGGEMEYAISFSAGIKGGRGTYSIQSDWLMPDYTSEDTMYNYQLWAASPVDVATMVTEVLGKLQAVMPVAQLFNANDLPSTYVSSISRQGTNINLVVNNNTANTTGYFTLTERETENSTASNNVVVPFTVNANGKTTVSIPVGDTYDANISMVFNNTTTDMLYMADGIWGTNGDNQTTVSQFNVSNNNNRTYPENEYPLLRDVQVQVTTPSYLSIYKYLKGGAIAVNLNEYKSLHFTANTNTEGMNLQVTIVKQGITNWNSQYTYTISNYQDGQTYKLALSDFKSTDNTLPAVMDASDVTTVIYNVINPTGQSTSITTGISNAAFSTEDIAYEKSLEVKTLGVSPNPNNGNFKVSFASPATAQLTLKVIDITGRIINSTVVNAITGTNEVSVSLNQGGATGIYFVTLEGQGVKYESKEMILKK